MSCVLIASINVKFTITGCGWAEPSVLLVLLYYFSLCIFYWNNFSEGYCYFNLVNISQVSFNFLKYFITVVGMSLVCLLTADIRCHIVSVQGVHSPHNNNREILNISCSDTLFYMFSWVQFSYTDKNVYRICTNTASMHHAVSLQPATSVASTISLKVGFYELWITIFEINRRAHVKWP